MRLLIVSHDVVGPLMAGPGIRYWELARALAPHAEVTLVAPQPIALEAPGVRVGHFAWGDAASLAAHLRRADVVLANGYLLEPHPELAAAEARLILDLYDPTLLENLELLRAAPAAEREARARRDAALLAAQIAAGDCFLCATERQRDLYLGALLAAGRVTPARADADPLLRGLIDVVPFGLPAEPPARSGPGLRAVIPGIGPDDPLILWSGGLWDWMDPLTLVRAMPEVLAAVPGARLVFLAGRHPGAVAAPRAPLAARALAEELGLLGRSVFFYEEWVPYARRADALLDATVVVSLHRQHLETAYAALRSRVLDHLWAGLPALLSDGDQAAALAREHGVAAVVPPEDHGAVAGALVALLSDAPARAAMAERARALAPRFAWPALVRPIVAFLEAAPLAQRERSPTPMSHAPASEADAQRLPAPPPESDVARVERGQLLQTTRNSALQALDTTWRLDGLAPAGGGRLGAARRALMERLVWPLLHPLIARQQEHNAAALRAAYAAAEYQDHLAAALGHARQRIEDLHKGLAELNERSVRERHLLAQQTRDFAEQLAGLEEAEQQLRALLRGEAAPPPSGGQETGEAPR
ncbi:MAG TPA: glycosyl transferase family 1 [Chloroflexaceae bacterium]|nr:glycosyl transferase family 1 [Chloroflexaceae bacterium]